MLGQYAQRGNPANTILLLTFVMAGCATEPRYSSFSNAADVERVVLLQDTQCYAFAFPDVLEAQAQWVLTDGDRLDVRGVMHAGDIVETNSPAEWEIAQRAYTPILQKLPMVMVPGNHDFGDGGSAQTRTSRMSEYFPSDTRFDSHDGDTFSADGWNSWTTFDIRDERWLWIGLEFAPRVEVIQWAKSVLATQEHDRAAIVTHAYLGTDGLRYGEAGATNQPFHPANYGLFSSDSADGQRLWEELVAGSNTVEFVFSGHVPRGFAIGEATRDDGGTTHEVMVDYQTGTQCPTEGYDGAGFLQVLEFSEIDGATRVRMIAYSPWENRFREDRGAEWLLDPPTGG